MSPPINIDGTDITGGTIDGTDFSEVTVDGTTVFSASTIPNSVIYQYTAENFASPWPNNVGSGDMSVNGMVSSTFTNGQDSVFGDGTNDFGTANGPESLPSNETFTIAFTCEYVNSSNNEFFMGTRDGTSDFFLRISNNGTTGSIELSLQDNDSDQNEVFTDADFSGDERAVVITKSGNTASAVDFYIDDMTTPVSSSINEDTGFDHTQFSSNIDLGFWDGNLDGSPLGNNLEMDVGIFEFATEAYSQNQRQNFVSRRPEV